MRCRSTVFFVFFVVFVCVVVQSDQFFRVNLTLNMTGNPSHPEDFIETWVRNQHHSAAKNSLHKCYNSMFYSGDEGKNAAGVE